MAQVEIEKQKITWLEELQKAKLANVLDMFALKPNSGSHASQSSKREPGNGA